ncbi:outer membrane assembly protein AsmA [Prodigiosinella aquatilis]|nr:outer membrane assembly protein AsmA [Prodigiosinella sp. LS101]WJV55252.1 outer membrane assembly protein AsmA [Prodigiosinella sp. LS101]WJV59613.1 outer membrane assembly protein AsmA [Pectobacteriaceae bacterium C111]
MRRFLTALVILLVVLVVGMTSLIVLINPNDFRDYMVHQVAARSGYKLKLDGELRWHVWPELSILSSSMSLSAPGAEIPLVSAENMRLDVKLWPLLSHRLEVKQVMLKGAVIRFTPESAAKRMSRAPIAPPGPSEPGEETGWRFDINRIEVADSLLVFQRTNNDLINVRDINLKVVRDSANQLRLELSSRINRDQRDLSFTLAASMDMQHFPQQVSASIEKFDYQLQGAGIPVTGISGKGSLNASYQQQPEKMTISQFALSANNSQLTGSATAVLGSVPDYILSLKSTRLDLDELLGLAQFQDSDAPADKAIAAKPVISKDVTGQKDNEVLRGFTAHVAIDADELIYHGLHVTQFALQATNQRGVLSVPTLVGTLGDGRFSLPGSMNIDASPSITVQPDLRNIALSPLLHAFGLPETLSGKLSLQGDMSGNSLSAAAVMSQWHGNAALQATGLRLNGLNIQQMIQQAVERNNSSVHSQGNYERYTEVRQMTAKARLSAGKLQLQALDGRSDILSLTGEGTFDLPAQRCDVNLGVKVTQGWQGDKNVVQMLQDIVIPFRLYGSWHNLNYQLQVDQILRNRLQDEMKKRLNEWIGKNKQYQKNKDIKQLMQGL